MTLLICPLSEYISDSKWLFWYVPFLSTSLTVNYYSEMRVRVGVLTWFPVPSVRAPVSGCIPHAIPVSLASATDNRHADSSLSSDWSCQYTHMHTQVHTNTSSSSGNRYSNWSCQQITSSAYVPVVFCKCKSMSGGSLKISKVCMQEVRISRKGKWITKKKKKKSTSCELNTGNTTACTVGLILTNTAVDTHKTQEHNRMYYGPDLDQYCSRHTQNTGTQQHVLWA